ncbi:TPA: type VII secretion protein EssA [Streptococcus agalactiae]
MKLKRFLACLLILSCMSQTSVLSDGLKNNDIHFDTKRLESDSQKNSGFQTELTKDLFKKEDLKKLDKNRQSKVSLQKKQSKQLFQYSNKGQSDRKKRIKQLFSEESNQFKFVTRTEEPTVSADIGHIIIYLVLISLVLILASIMTFKIKDKKDEYTY